MFEMTLEDKFLSTILEFLKEVKSVQMGIAIFLEVSLHFLNK